MNITRAHRKANKARARRRPIQPMRDTSGELVWTAETTRLNKEKRQQKQDNFYREISQRGAKS